jgi:hypothetical protein
MVGDYCGVMREKTCNRVRRVVMRGFILALSVAGLVGCSIFGGSGGPDPLAGWGGVWSGQHRSSYGDSGSLEIELSTDTAGVAVGIARFESGYGMQRTSMDALVLTGDSIRTMLKFEGMVAEILGTRVEDIAEGTYVVRPEGQGDVVDSGSWELSRQPAGQ